MTFEIVTTPANTPASLLFQQCLVEIVPDNKVMNMAKEEVAGYFLNKIELNFFLKSFSQLVAQCM